MTRRVWAALVAIAIPATTAFAQGGGGSARVVDRIVAVVGSRTILASQIDERMVLLEAQGQTLPTDSAARAQLGRQMLDEMIDEELLVQHAERDTAVKVTDQEVQDQVDRTVDNVRSQFGSDAEFQAEIRRAGFASLEEWRRYLLESQRRASLGQRLIEQLRGTGKLRPIPPSEEQLKEFWDANQATLPPRPASVSFRQLIVTPTADSAARLRALHLADSLARAIRNGADFATVASRFSDDSTTRASGGDLGWFRRGQMVPAFEAVAFNQRPGAISPPVETQYGFHIIRVDRAQPGEVQAHHVLIAPDISPVRVDAARRLADSLHGVLRTGANFDSLARRYHDPNEPKIAETVVLDSLPPDYRAAIGPDTTTGMRPVFVVGQGSPKPKFVILDVTDRIPAGPVRFEDVKARVRDRLGGDLALRHYLAQLRRQTYIDIRY